MGNHIHTAFLVAFIGICLSAQTQQRPPRSGASRDTQTPQIIVASQPDSSLSVSTSTRWATPGREILDLYIVVKNTYTKSVRSYTTRLDFNSAEGQKVSCLIENIYSPGKVLKMEQTDGKSRFIGVEKNVPAPAVQVSIDYIEFADGSAWGEDRCQTAEYLTGERVGGKAAIEWIQNLIKEKGPEAAVEAIRGGGISVEKPYNQSGRWEEGFGRGVETISRRVLEAYQNEGAEELEVVLRKPYDASGVRQ